MEVKHLSFQKTELNGIQQKMERSLMFWRLMVLPLMSLILKEDAQVR